VAPDGSNDVRNDHSDPIGAGGGAARLQSLQENNNNTAAATSQQRPLLSPTKQQTAAVDEAPPSPTVLSERSAVADQQQLSKTLPRANNSAGQDFKRSSRTPRTQSDPSNMPNKTDATIATLQMMMMPPPRHSESASSLQKRSQSDLSQVGSTESGYSSLSLNVPSPSHSPTRLSSGDFVVGPSPPSLHHSTIVTATTAGSMTTTATASAAAVISTTIAATSITSINAATAVVTDLDESAAPTWRSAEPPAAAHHHHHHRPLSRSCSTVSSDPIPPQTVDPKSDAGSPPAVRHKSPEEIECEELSRDLISHLSPSDKLHNILGELFTVVSSSFDHLTSQLSVLFAPDHPITS